MQADTELYDQQPTIGEFDEIISLITELQNESVNLPTDLNIETILNNIECKTVKKHQCSTIVTRYLKR